ncbi:hypothetical protein ACFWOG_17150 [Kitasatospora sp. NPDC058406]|uniref:hypothetical protein n=1 Tax=Kitasatospora sp. NPDC058406 TaxID=3346483 RepID=UPI0036485BC8
MPDDQEHQQAGVVPAATRRQHMAQQEIRNSAEVATVAGAVVQIGTATGPINVGNGPQHNSTSTSTSGNRVHFHGAGGTYSESTVTSIPLDLV